MLLGWPGEEAVVRSLASGSARVAGVSMLGVAGALPWSQDEAGLRVRLPAHRPCEHAYTLKIILA
jgi:alpha-L-fucosidase